MFAQKHIEHAHWGFAGLIFGVLGLIAAMLAVSGALIEPQQSAGASIGQLAAEIRQAAKFALSGADLPAPAPAKATMDLNRIVMIATPILAALAMALGGMSLYRHEPAQLSRLAIGFGLGAIVMQFVFWLALLVCGIALLISVISNMGAILGE